MTSVFARSTADGRRATGFAGAFPEQIGVARRLLALSLPRFLAVGCIGLATDAAAFSIMSSAGLSDAASRTLSLAVATFVTWRLNRRFTFAESGRKSLGEAARYVAVALCAQGFNLAVFLLLRRLAPAVPALVSLGTSAVMAAGFSFAGQSLVTFRARLAGPAPAIFGTRS